MHTSKKRPQKKKDSQSLYFIQGLLLLALSLFLSLSLISYRDGDATKNWLGLVGHIMGWTAYYLFGLASFLIPLFCGWIGWKILIKKPLE